MKILFLGGSKDGGEFELAEELMSVSFSHSSKDSTYHKTEIVVSIDGTSKSVDVMISEDLSFMSALEKFVGRCNKEV
jgi:hypothetical protein